MRKLAFFVSLLGIFCLLLYLHFSSPIIVNFPSDLTNIEENQKVIAFGIVKSQNDYESYSSIILESGMIVRYSSKNLPQLVGKNVSILGFVDTFQKPKIKALRIKWR